MPPTSDSISKTKTMSLLSKEDSFTEKFALYLAVGLMGPTKVIEYLNDGERKDEQPAVPLYWRSKLMIPDPSRMLYCIGDTSDTPAAEFSLTKMLFFDATFGFVKSGEAKENKSDLQSTQRRTSSRVLVSFGFFLLLQKGPEAASGDQNGAEFGGGHYISTQPLDYQQIVSYMNSLQLDRDSVSPAKLANSMAEEFLRQENNVLTADYVSTKISPVDLEKLKTPEVTNTTPPNQSRSLHDVSPICINIPCKSMGDSSGKLVLKYPSSDVTIFDRSALRFLYWDFSKNPNQSKNDEPLLSKKDLVDEAFDRWRIQVKTTASNDIDDKDRGKQKSNKPTVSATNMNSNDIRDSDRTKKRGRSKGMGILPSARRKRNKGLVYDTK